MFRNTSQLLKTIFILLVIITIIPTTPLSSQAGEVNKLLIIDVSGSMRARMGNMTKMDVAKKVICEYITNLPSTDNVGIIAYGHRRKSDCSDVEYLAPLGKNNRKLLISKVKGLKAMGKTPIATSLKKAVEIIDTIPGEKSIILISDGRESCKAKPCDLIAKYIGEGKQFINHVIGFDVDRRARKQLECIADAGGGNYYPVDDLSGLQIAFQSVQNNQPIVQSPPEIKKPAPEIKKPVSDDYLGEGVYIAAIQFHSWEDTGSMATSHPVKIITPASAATKNQSEVEIQDKKKTKKWTPFVFKSHPAKKEELKVGTWILCVNEGFEVKDKSKSAWKYAKIGKLDDMFKNLVGAVYLNTYGGRSNKQFNVHYKNIRIVENPFNQDKLWFGKYN